MKCGSTGLKWWSLVVIGMTVAVCAPWIALAIAAFQNAITMGGLR